MAASSAAYHESPDAILHGYSKVGIRGIAETSAARRCTLSEDYTAYLGSVAEAVHRLHTAGIDGLAPEAAVPLTYAT